MEFNAVIAMLRTLVFLKEQTGEKLSQNYEDAYQIYLSLKRMIAADENINFSDVERCLNYLNDIITCRRFFLSELEKTVYSTYLGIKDKLEKEVEDAKNNMQKEL